MTSIRTLKKVYKTKIRDVAQLVAHLLWERGVVSSSLAVPTKEWTTNRELGLPAKQNVPFIRYWVRIPVTPPLIRYIVWRGGRVVECNGLENRRTETFPEFESRSLRQYLPIV